MASPQKSKDQLEREYYEAALTGSLPGGGGGGSEVEVKNDIGNALNVKDDYAGAPEYLAEQNGAGAVLTFDFLGGAVQMVWVTDVGTVTTNTSHATTDGSNPTNSKGVPVFNQSPTPIVATTSQVKVFAPVGSVINVWGSRRA